MKIQAKIFSMFSVSMILLIVVGFTAYSEMRAVNEEFNVLKEERLTESQIMNDMIINIHEEHSVLADYLVTSDPSLLEKIDEHHIKFQTVIREFEKIPGGVAGTYELDVAEMELKVEQTHALETSIFKTRPQILENEKRLNNDLSKLVDKWHEMQGVLDEMVATAPDTEQMHAGIHLNVHVSSSLVDLNTFLITGEEVERREYEGHIEDFEEHLTEHEKEGGDPALYARVNASFENITAMANAIFTLYDENTRLKASEEQMLQEHAELSRDIGLILDGLSFFVDEKTDKAAQKMSEDVNDAVFRILYLTALLIVLGTALSIVLSRKITTPLTLLKDAAFKFGEGNLDVRTDIKSRDEIGELAGAFNQMAEDLKKRGEEVRKKTEDLEKAIGESTESRMALLNMMEDMTETKGELERANRLKDLFTDILRHDLLNPIGVIGNIVEILEDDKNLRDSSEFLVIKRNVKKLEEIVYNASDYAKIESAELKRVELDLAKLLESVIDDLGPYIKDKGMKVEFEPAGEYKANASVIIESVFVNLLSNAIKYSPDGTEIRITIEDSVERWKISFADQGDGVADEYKGAIFDRFARKDKGGVKGTGLGLAIVKRIVEMHGGRVWVEDNPEGGSVFYVEIPK